MLEVELLSLEMRKRDTLCYTFSHLLIHTWLDRTMTYNG